ncbi:MAG: hypothetical protein M1827_003673 [Pycnora praestabilis]|nr:MAG: hypothetical protein M1827_003673 [Pycnora praestabilis]
MYRNSRPEGLDFAQPQLTRSQSASSDRPSPSSLTSLVAPPTLTNPDPAYIAATTASHIVKSNHPAFHSQHWENDPSTQSPSKEPMVSPASLKLVNSFLDQLLYSFLSTARSTSFVALRSAISEVLKPKLARDAMAGADQELQDLGIGEDEEVQHSEHGQGLSRYWDLDVAWKRIRLQCMVYTRLGDMEEEDEEVYIAQEQLESSSGVRSPTSDHAGIASPTVAIFLTDVLEYIGEQALVAAGQAAYHRSQLKRANPNDQHTVQPPNSIAERMIVGELDTEKIALNATLGRLWRTWRKHVRSPNLSTSRSLSPESDYWRKSYPALSVARSRSNSASAVDGSKDQGLSHGTSVAEVLNEIPAANVSLPINDDDVEEIEVPGLAIRNEEDREGTLAKGANTTQRPRSMMVFPPFSIDLPTPSLSPPHIPNNVSQHPESLGSPIQRSRSRSLPTPGATPFVSPSMKVLDHSETTTPPQASEGPHEPARHDAIEAQALSGTAVGKKTDPDDTRSLKEHVEEHKGLVAGVLAGATAIGLYGTAAIGSAAIAGIAAAAVGEAPEATTNDIQDPSTPVKLSFQNEEPEILETTRVSFEEPSTPVELVRTRSRGNSSVRSGTVADVPQVESIEEEAHLPGTVEEADEDLGAIGVARTSDVPVAAFPLSPHTIAGRASQEQPMQGEGSREKFRNEGQSADDIAWRDRRSSRLVFAAPPGLRSAWSPENILPLAGETRSGASNISFATVPQTSLPNNSAPPLAPLRELAEVAAESPTGNSMTDISPEAHDAESSPDSEPMLNGHSPWSDHYASSIYSHSKHPSNGSKLSDQRHLSAHQPPVNLDRAAVQRVYTTPMAAPEPTSAKDRMSDGFNLDKRPNSGSQTSQVSNKLKGLIARQHDDGEKDSQQARVSSDGSSSVAAQQDDKQRSFEQLINSDQTIQYTLTPQNMREMESPDSPRWASPRPGTAELADFLKSTGPQTEDPPRPTTSRSIISLKGTNGLRAHPLNDSRSQVIQPSTPIKSQFGSSISTSSNPIISPQVVGPREARYEKESTRDFADFIRSTGPKRDSVAAVGDSDSRPATAVQVQQRPAVTSRSISSPDSTHTQITKSTSGLEPTTPQTSITTDRSGPRKRLQARSATVGHGDTSALIDFIRQGPPGNHPTGDGQASRIATPSGSMMNPNGTRAGSHGLTGSRIVSANSLASTHGSSSQAKSVQSSVNSRTGLLEKRSLPVNQSNGVTAPSRSVDAPQPARKQRRVRDPYAIDTDSDEEAHVVAVSKPRREEESLMDFLRNVPPPDKSPVSPVLETTTKQSPKTLQKKTSSPNVGSRFGRNTSSSTPLKDPVKTGPPSSEQPSRNKSPNSSAKDAPQVSLNQVISGSPLFGSSVTLNTTIGGQLSSYNATAPIPDSPVETPRRKNLSSRTAPKISSHPQARGARMESARSNDLADFLKNSEPPPTTQPPAPLAVREETGFRQMFRKKKKNVAVPA